MTAHTHIVPISTAMEVLGLRGSSYFFNSGRFKPY